MGEAAQGCPGVIHSWGLHLPAVTGDVIQGEDGWACPPWQVLLGDVVVQGRREG